MDPKDLAMEFLERFAAADPVGIRALLADELCFRGPFVAADDADAYVATLDGTLEPAGINILSSTADPEHVVVFYEYVKPDATVTVAQRFTIRQERIVELLLVFDASLVR